MKQRQPFKHTECHLDNHNNLKIWASFSMSRHVQHDVLIDYSCLRTPCRTAHTYMVSLPCVFACVPACMTCHNIFHIHGKESCLTGKPGFLKDLKCIKSHKWIPKSISTRNLIKTVQQMSILINLFFSKNPLIF